jgi:hypothetical protein
VVSPLNVVIDALWASNNVFEYFGWLVRKRYSTDVELMTG